jgi:glycogen operon protein
VEDPGIVTLRRRQRRNLLVTLFISQGVPMLLAGDEFGRTQRGNNNAYCQDNEISWIDWSLVDNEADLLDFVRSLSKLRREHPVFQRRRFFHGHKADDGTRDIVWLTPAGEEMSAGDWHTGYAKSLAVFLNGDAITEPGTRGERIADDSFLLLINAHHEDMSFTLPEAKYGKRWQRVLDTADDGPGESPFAEESWPADASVEVTARSVRILRCARL